MSPMLGFPEIIILFFVVVLSLAFPLAILFALYAIYKRLKSIDENLKKTQDVK